jgi:phospholipase/carboxylesterase
MNTSRCGWQGSADRDYDAPIARIEESVHMDLIHTVWEPAGEGPHPSIIAMHGWGANALDLIGLAPYVADGRFMVIAPQGPLEVPIGPTRGYGWFPIRMGSTPDRDAIEEAISSTAEFVEAAIQRYPVDRRKLVILGFSQGGAMAYRLALANPAKYAALVALSTWFAPELRDAVTDRDALQRLPTMVQHGRADDMIEIARARSSVEILRELRVPLVYREYDCGHEISADGLQDLSDFLSSKVLSPIVTARA